MPTAHGKTTTRDEQPAIPGTRHDIPHTVCTFGQHDKVLPAGAEGCSQRSNENQDICFDLHVLHGKHPLSQVGFRGSKAHEDAQVVGHEEWELLKAQCGGRCGRTRDIWQIHPPFGARLVPNEEGGGRDDPAPSDVSGGAHPSGCKAQSDFGVGVRMDISDLQGGTFSDARMLALPWISFLFAIFTDAQIAQQRLSDFFP